MVIAYFFGPPQLMPDHQRCAYWWTECPPMCWVLFRRLYLSVGLSNLIVYWNFPSGQRMDYDPLSHEFLPISFHWGSCALLLLYMCIFSCDQAPFPLCSHYRIITKFSGVITIGRRDVHAKGQGQRSKVKVTEVMTPFSRFRTISPVWIHIWQWNDAQCLMILRRGALLFFKVIHQISRSHGSKNRRFWPKLGVSGL